MPGYKPPKKSSAQFINLASTSNYIPCPKDLFESLPKSIQKNIKTTITPIDDLINR